MGKTAAETAGDTGQGPATRLLVADVGGTYARVGVLTLCAGDITLLAHRRYACAAFPDLASILRQFRSEATSAGAAAVDTCVVATAGVMQGEHLRSGNLPWAVPLEQTRRDAGLARVHWVNDFEALAWALPHVTAGQMTQIGGEATTELKSPVLLLGPGTGLGAALMLTHAGRIVVQPSEAGQAALAPETAQEMELLRVLQTRFGRVSCERVCSGPGLLNLAWAMAMLQGRTSPWQTPADLVADAERGDGLAQACMQVFCQWFSSVAGDLAMVLQARTVCLAGGVTGHVRKFLAAGGFMRRFVDKGVLEEALRAVPVLMLEHGELGLIGAGAWYAQVIATPEA